LVTQAAPRDLQLERWLTTVDRKTRRHGMVDRTLRDDQTGPLTIPLRFGFKVLEIGPVAAFKLGFTIVANRVGHR